MFIRSVLEVLWARRLIVLISLVCCLLGGVGVIVTSPPRYQATAKVILDYIKPDPITGEFVNSKMAEAYVKTQMQTIRDFQVAVPAAEALGLLDNPDLQSAYASIPDVAPADFPKWVARRIIASTGVRLLPETNIIEISFAADTPDGAQQYAEAIRDAYVGASISAKRESAASSAERLTVQAQSEAAVLAKLEAAKRELQDTHGVMPALEAARLTELVSAIRPLYVEQAPDLPSAAKLAAADAQLAEANRTLGPNHPMLKSMRAAREVLAAQAQQEREAAATVGQGAGQAERARQAAIEIQRGRVLSQRELALEMRLIDEEIERRREVYNGLNTSIANFRQLTTLAAVNLTPFGDIDVKPAPVFPNPFLILGGTGFLGLALGSLLALLVEFLNRRARRPQHLVMAVGAPLLGVVPKIASLEPSHTIAPRRRYALWVPRRKRTAAA